jgi:hypothetical protein
MLTFKQFVAELATEDVTISSAELREMTERFGDKVLQMGHLQPDGSMLVPIDCILEGARSVSARTITEAAESINNQQTVSMLRSGEALVENVIEARERKMRRSIHAFQNERDADKAHESWKQIEKEVFGVEYND